MVRYGATFSVLVVGGGLAGGSVYIGAPMEMAGGVAVTTLLAAGALQVRNIVMLPGLKRPTLRPCNVPCYNL